MSPPNGVSRVGNSGSVKNDSSSGEREAYLKASEFFFDPAISDFQKQWENNREFRLSYFHHSQLVSLIDLFTRYMNNGDSKVQQKLQEAIQAWTASADFKIDLVNLVALKNMYRILGNFRADENVQRAAKLRALLPPLKDEVPVGKTAAPLAADKRYFAVGGELLNDSVPLALLDKVGIPVSTLATEKTYFTLKPSLDLPMGSGQVGMLRLSGGLFQAKGIPGGDPSIPGTGYRVGGDFGFVNPYSAPNERAGLGLELTGVVSSAADKSGLPTPSPLLRLHLFNESDWTIPIGGDFDLGFSSLLNHQDTYLVLGNDQKLSVAQTLGGNLQPGGPEQAPFAYTGSLFVASPIHWFGVSGRYYLNGRPDKERAEDQSQPFRPGEGFPKLAGLWTGEAINLNRRDIIPAFTNTQVFLGTFEPLGVPSSTQFDTISLGLTAYSLLDGYAIAKNAQLRGEIWRRGDPLLKKVMLGTDALLLGFNFYRAVTAKGDPPVDQTIAEFVKDPGSVTDFKGRAGRINVELAPIEAGLSVLEATGVAGNIGDRDTKLFNATSETAAVLGLLGFLFSGPLSGNSCGPDGTLLRCGFYGQKSNYFHSGIDASPQNMRDIENQYAVSTSSAALASWGISRILKAWLLSKGSPAPTGGAEKKKGATAFIQDPYVNASVNSGSGANVTFGGRF